MAESGTTSGPELLVELDRASHTPLHKQLSDGLRAAIRAGRLASGNPMPSTRVLASDLGVSRRLVVDVYSQLTAEGFLHSAQGSGTRVALVDSSDSSSRAVQSPPSRFDIDFSPGTPDLGSFPRHAWLRALRHGLDRAESSVLGYRHGHGLPAMRAVLAGYLSRTRGVVADPERIVVCSGVTQGLALLARCLDGPLAMEDPGFWAHRMMLQYNGIRPIPVPVDADGLDVASLRDSGARAILTTPAHQSPTGVVLPAARRTALCGWARDGRLIIEDDYDAEYRYDRAPIGALQGIASDRVVYLGSVSKTLAPGLRLGWMVLPDHLVDPVRTAKSVADNGSSVTDQFAFTELIESGAYDRHLRQMRRRYLSRRNALLDALAQHLPWVTVLGAAAGIQLSVQFPDGYPIHELARRAAEMRVRVEPLTRWYANPTAAPAGLILGYANLTESRIREGIRILGRASD